MDRKAEIQALLEKYRQNRCTQEELRALATLLQTSALRDDLADLLGESLLDGIPTSFLEKPEVQESLHRVFNRMMPDETQPIILPRSRRRWKLPAIAAALLFAIGTGWYFFSLDRSDSMQPEMVSSEADVQAGGNRAILTLADGRIIDLRADQHGISIGENVRYLDGSEILTDNGEAAEQMTLHTPNGGTYQIVLADGTEVWLNAGSTLTYPTKFATDKRQVTLEGEAFFSVSHHAHAPFTVLTDGQEINVLGTEFNISAYKGEVYSSTTLVTGSVQVRNITSGEVVQLQPGSQSVINEGRTTVKTADLEVAVGWKNGVFLFNDTELREAMKQVARWYDVEVSYEGNVPETHFFGQIGRDKTLAQVLKIFKQGKVEFQFDKAKNKLTVYHRQQP